MKLFLNLFFLMMGFTLYFGQNYQEQFEVFAKKDDTLSARKLLLKWEKEKPNDADFYVAAVNYYFTKSKTEVHSLAKEQQNKDGFEIKNADGKVVANFGGKTSFNKVFLARTFYYFDNAIAMFPNRLDIRFGKIYTLGEIGDYENFTSEVIKTIQYSSKIKNKWLWLKNHPLKNAEREFLNGVQAYSIVIFNKNDDSIVPKMRIINEELLKYYPNNVEGYTNIGLSYMIEKQYDKALKQLFEAEKINSKDYIVLKNIAFCYREMKDKKNAIKYYEMVKLYGDDFEKTAADQEIKLINQ